MAGARRATTWSRWWRRRCAGGRPTRAASSSRCGAALWRRRRRAPRRRGDGYDVDAAAGAPTSSPTPSPSTARARRPARRRRVRLVRHRGPAAAPHELRLLVREAPRRTRCCSLKSTCAGGGRRAGASALFSQTSPIRGGRGATPGRRAFAPRRRWKQAGGRRSDRRATAAPPRLAGRREGGPRCAPALTTAEESRDVRPARGDVDDRGVGASPSAPPPGGTAAHQRAASPRVPLELCSPTAAGRAAHQRQSASAAEPERATGSDARCGTAQRVA